MERIIILVLIHITGIIVSIIYCWKGGVFAEASKYGDGYRYALPSNILFECIIWEVMLFIYGTDFLEDSFNNFVRKKVNKNEGE